MNHFSRPPVRGGAALQPDGGPRYDILNECAVHAGAGGVWARNRVDREVESVDIALPDQARADRLMLGLKAAGIQAEPVVSDGQRFIVI